jgi:CD109 antigen
MKSIGVVRGSLLMLLIVLCILMAGCMGSDTEVDYSPSNEAISCDQGVLILKKMSIWCWSQK